MYNEFDTDFDDKPIYIRHKVQSCSNFDTIDIQKANSFFEKELARMRGRSIKLEPSNIQNQLDYDFSRMSSESSVEEWNAPDYNSISYKPDSFSDRVSNTPRNLSTSLSTLVNNLFENPDGRMTNSQRIIIILFTAFEAYRTIISSFLTVFVPQNCGGYSCTLLQNIIPKDNLETAAISFNTFMAVYFCWLFTIERIRETVVKRYLIADKSSATDKEYLMNMLSELDPTQRQRILRLNQMYRIFAQVLLLLFFVNAGVSCVVIQKNYLNNTTATVFITNTLFMINRIHKALKITSSGEYNIYSAYRSDNLLYNRSRGEIAKNYVPSSHQMEI